MKKVLKYLAWLPFAVCLGSLIIYIVYTVKIKFNPAIIVTDQTVSVLKTYLMIALVSLFVGLLIILIRKIYKLLKEDGKLIYKEEKKKYKETILEEKDETLKSILKDTSIEEDTPIVEEKEEVVINNEKEYKFKLDAVSCPECGGLISKDAVICPHCGILFDEELLKFLNKYQKKNKTVTVEYKQKKKPMVIVANILLIVLFIILTFLVTNLVLNKAKENKTNITPVQIINEN